jgi:branched-chain amino acid aminotransferase
MHHALARGTGLFETLRVEEGRPRFVGRHVARLRASLAASTPMEALVEAPPGLVDRHAPAGRSRPFEQDVIAAVAAAWAELAGRTDATQAEGDRPEARHSEAGSAGARRAARAKLVVAGGSWSLELRWISQPPGPVDGFSFDGAPVRAQSATLARHKWTSYAPSMLAAHGHSVFVNDRDELCEAAHGNLFVYLDGRWTTPPTNAPCLPGVAREVLLGHGEDVLGPVCVEPVAWRDLARAEAAFLTNALVGAWPVTRIGSHRFNRPESPLGGTPMIDVHALTQRARALLDRCAAAERSWEAPP